MKLLTDVDMILDYENGIREWITRVICYYAEGKNKYSSDFDEKKKLHTFSILILKIIADGATVYFQWVESKNVQLCLMYETLFWSIMKLWYI